MAERRDCERRDRDRDKHEADRRQGAQDRGRGDASRDARARGHDEASRHRDSRSAIVCIAYVTWGQHCDTVCFWSRPPLRCEVMTRCSRERARRALVQAPILLTVPSTHRYDSRRRSPPRLRRTRSRSPSRHPWDHQHYDSRPHPRGAPDGWQTEASRYWREWPPHPPPDWWRDAYYPHQRWDREPWPADRREGRYGPHGWERGPAPRRVERDDHRRRGSDWEARWDLDDQDPRRAATDGSPVPPAVDFEARARDTG